MGVYIKDMTLDEFYECGDDCQTLIGIGQADEFPPHGKWVFHNAGFGFTHHCSNCNFEVKEQWIGFYNFCPNCGFDMREAEVDDASTIIETEE